MAKSNKNSLLISLFLFLGVLIFGYFFSVTGDKEQNTENEKAIVLPPPIKTDTINPKLDSILRRYQSKTFFNGSVLVANKGNVIHKNNYGYADLRKKTPLTDSSIFHLASVSKQFTAAAILILVDEKKLKLTDKLRDFYPQLPYEGITINHLLNHTSGLPLYFWFADHVWKSDTPPTNEQMIETMAKNEMKPFFAPGQKFEYSNTGYFILASIVEKVSGQTFSNFLKTKIFDPLNMNQTYVYTYPFDSIRPYQLMGYQVSRRGRAREIPPFLNDGIFGDKTVYSTSKDLFFWLKGLNEGKILSQNSLKLMYTQGKTNSGWKAPYGMGFRLENRNNENIIFHNGKWNGFRTSVKNYIDNDIWLILLNHTNYSNVSGITLQLNEFLKEEFKENNYQTEQKNQN